LKEAPHGWAGCPLATSEQTLGDAAAAFVAQPSLARSTRRPYDQTLARLARELGGDRTLSRLTVEAVTAAWGETPFVNHGFRRPV
jgi:predicted secreted protein